MDDCTAAMVLMSLSCSPKSPMLPNFILETGKRSSWHITSKFDGDECWLTRHSMGEMVHLVPLGWRTVPDLCGCFEDAAHLGWLLTGICYLALCASIWLHCWLTIHRLNGDARSSVVPRSVFSLGMKKEKASSGPSDRVLSLTSLRCCPRGLVKFSG